MKAKLQVTLVLLSIILFPKLSFPEIHPYTVSLPEKMPGIVGQTVQKDKPAIVLISVVVRGTALSPSFVVAPTVAGGIAGSWQSAIETVTFMPDGHFTGVNIQTGPFSGTYFIQGNVITVAYASPVPVTRQLTFALAGNTLTIYNPQTGPITYTRTGAGTSADTGTNFVANAENSTLVRDTSANAQIISEPVTMAFSGTGFIVSPDGYIVTNAHVVLAGQDLKLILLQAVVNNMKNNLWAQAAKLYNIPGDQREKIVEILAKKGLDYFMQFGQITDISLNIDVFSGVAVAGEDLKLKSWPAVVKKQGAVIEKIGNETTSGKDIAIIKVDKDNLPTVTLGDSNKVQAGDPIFIIGYPGIGLEQFFKQESILEPTTTQGVISAKRTLLSGTHTLQTDAAINHGNSGGPAYNDKGEVIGIATFGAGASENIEAIKFLVAINHAKEFMKELNVENKHSILDKKYSEALNAFWKKDCRTTIKKMKEVLTLYPGHPYANYYINACENAIVTGKYPSPLKTIFIVAIIAAVLGVVIVTAFLLLRKKKPSSLQQ